MLGKPDTTARMIARLAFALAATIPLLPHPAFAWGHEGHQVIALIAERHLTPAARAEVSRLLTIDGASSMAEVASWADDFRAGHRQTGPWHFVDIPLAATSYDAARDCPAGACVVTKVQQFAAALADRSGRDQRRVLALKFLIHLVGDVHQPLHCADHDDRGGNDVRVRYGGHPTNLHHVWDTELVIAAGGSDTPAFAERLDRATSPERAERLAGGGPVEWANEAHAAAISVAYGRLPEGADDDLAGAYSEAAVPVVDALLEEAGLRLAALLNTAAASATPAE